MSNKPKKTFNFESDVAYTPKVEVTLGDADGAKTVTIIKISTDGCGVFEFSSTPEYALIKASGSGEQMGILESLKAVVSIIETYGSKEYK